jgi:hypothetical protein
MKHIQFSNIYDQKIIVYGCKRMKIGAEEVAQVVECLPSKPEAMNSNPSTEKKKNQTKYPTMGD